MKYEVKIKTFKPHVVESDTSPKQEGKVVLFKNFAGSPTHIYPISSIEYIMPAKEIADVKEEESDFDAWELVAGLLIAIVIASLTFSIIACFR
jgi:hypothetical protein